MNHANMAAAIPFERNLEVLGGLPHPMPLRLVVNSEEHLHYLLPLHDGPPAKMSTPLLFHTDGNSAFRMNILSSRKKKTRKRKRNRKCVDDEKTSHEKTHADYNQVGPSCEGKKTCNLSEMEKNILQKVYGEIFEYKQKEEEQLFQIRESKMWYDADMMRERNDWLRRVFQGNSNPVFVSSNRVEPTGHSLLQTTVQPPSLSVDVPLSIEIPSSPPEENILKRFGYLQDRRKTMVLLTLRPVIPEKR